MDLVKQVSLVRKVDRSALLDTATLLRDEPVSQGFSSLAPRLEMLSRERSTRLTAPPSRISRASVIAVSQKVKVTR